MIRSTVNATTLAIHKSGMGVGQTYEVCFGSIDGTVDSATHEMTGDDWWALQTAEPDNTISIVPSDHHHGPVV